MKVLKLDEMAYSRTDAIDRCANLGKQFVKHFNKIYHEDKVETKKHHAMEMQTWVNDISSIKLSYNNRSLNEKNIYDWFLTCGSLPFDLFKDENEAIVYEEFCNYLLDYCDRNVMDALHKILLI